MLNAASLLTGILPFALVYIISAVLPRWWLALLLSCALAGLTLWAHYDWLAFERATPHHGGKFAGFEVVLLAGATIVTALALAGRGLVHMLRRHGAGMPACLTVHVAMVLLPIALLWSIRHLA